MLHSSWESKVCAHIFLQFSYTNILPNRCGWQALPRDGKESFSTGMQNLFSDTVYSELTWGYVSNLCKCQVVKYPAENSLLWKDDDDDDCYYCYH